MVRSIICYCYVHNKWSRIWLQYHWFWPRFNATKYKKNVVRYHQCEEKSTQRKELYDPAIRLTQLVIFNTQITDKLKFDLLCYENF